MAYRTYYRVYYYNHCGHSWPKDFRLKDKALQFAQEKAETFATVWVKTESNDPLFQCEIIWDKEKGLAMAPQIEKAGAAS